MFMSVVAPVPGVSVHPELAGIRVLLTGLDRETGVDVARAFADHKVRLVLQSADSSPAVTELVSVLALTAAEIRFFNEPIGTDPVRFAQTAVQAFGGLDAVVNLISFTADEIAGLAGLSSVEDLVADKLATAVHITRVAANRMSLTWTEGSILNAVLMPAPTTAREAALAGYVRTTLAAVTKGEAQAVAERAVRVNAIGPRSLLGEERAGAHLSTGPEIASLALHLASRKGRQLSGHMFDAEQVVLRGC
jgi:3-oxoacyl-[acyl-carrier protein] reductase